MTAAFSGFTTESIQFLADLSNHNDRAWFQPRKAEFERLLRDPLEALCLALADRFERRELPLKADTKHSPFRIYHDTRFSRDKSPYKTHLGASFPWTAMGGGPEGSADGGPHGNGGYFHFQPGEMFAGGGMWMPDKPRVDAFRRLVLDVTEACDLLLVHSSAGIRRPDSPDDGPPIGWVRDSAGNLPSVMELAG